MAHFALVQDGVVQRVEVLVNEVITTPSGKDSELKGKRFMVSLYPETTEDQWVQCSYNANMRGVYPGYSYTWDGSNFAPPVETIIEPVKDATV